MLRVHERGLEERLASLVRLVLALGEQNRHVELLRDRVGEPRVALQNGRLRVKVEGKLPKRMVIYLLNAPCFKTFLQ